ncbi:MAG TPA: hypothetical protein VEA78_02225 [Acidimicrobiales bacterium]|nr:hypothetical protein [Acidimicrobiales bacterium]
MTSVAFGARSRTSSRLPVWSWSSWLMNTQRTSARSTTLPTASNQASRLSALPVSTITGSAPTITDELMATSGPSGVGKSSVMTCVPGATS